jgi:hypothetical protein
MGSLFGNFLTKNECDNCGATLTAGDDRVAVIAVELRSEDAEEPGRGDSSGAAYCMKCAAEMKELTCPSVWKIQSDLRAHPSAGNPSEDILHSAVSLSEMADERRKDGTQSDDDALGDILSSSRPYHEARPPDEEQLRARVRMFLRSPRAQKMAKVQKVVALLASYGVSQDEIADALEIDQATVSRRLDEVFFEAGKSR